MKDTENVVSVDLQKKCAKCQEVKSLNNFHKQSSRFDGLNPYCKICIKILCQKWYSKNKEKVAKDTLEYQRNNKESLLKDDKERISKLLSYISK